MKTNFSNFVRNSATTPRVLSALALGALLPAARADVVATYGAMQEIPAPPSVVEGSIESNTKIRIFNEVQSHLTATTFLANTTNPGDYGPALETPFDFPKEFLLNSHLVHFDPVGTTGSYTLTGKVVFDEPILAVIYRDDELDGSDAEIGQPGTVYPVGSLRGKEDSQNDRVSFSGRVLDVELTTDANVDQVRVITGRWMGFSLDMGSDSEFMDPTTDGNEIFDCGDFYVSNGTSLLHEIWDDSDIVPAPLSEPDAPWGAGPGWGCPNPTQNPCLLQYCDKFDLDGFDEVNLPLHNIQQRPIYRDQIPAAQRLGIFRARWLVISMDDDAAAGWAGYCKDPKTLPSTSTSNAGATYGTARDELMLLELPIGPFAVASPNPYSDEAELHTEMWPNPLPQWVDDDVDALDWRIGQLEYKLISTDHEGTAGTSPGVIYSTDLSMGVGDQPNVAVTIQMLGIPSPEVDIDAFELAWLPDQLVPNAPLALALLYSVDQDDPMTLGIDESGGLDPRVIYYSFLDGASGVLVSALEDDVDAIAVRPYDRSGTQPQQ